MYTVLSFQLSFDQGFRRYSYLFGGKLSVKKQRTSVHYHEEYSVQAVTSSVHYHEVEI